jgi:hypothetical protein
MGYDKLTQRVTTFPTSSTLDMTLMCGRRDSAVCIATGYGLDDQEVKVRVPVRATIFTSPCCPDRLWSPPSLLSKGYRGLFPRG